MALLAPGVLAAPSSTSPSGAGGGSGHLFQVQGTHLAFLRGTARMVGETLDREDSGLPVDWAKVIRRVKAASDTERDLEIREAMLSDRSGTKGGGGGGKADDILVQLLDRRRLRVAQLLDRLASRCPRPLEGTDAFTASGGPPIPSGRPGTPAQVRLLLRTTPMGAVNDLFGVTACITHAKLPVRSR